MVKDCIYDSKVAREILSIIISIQREHIYHVKDHEETKRIAESIRKFKFSYHNLEQKWTALLLAIRFNGIIPKDGEDRSLISKSLTALKNYCNQLYKNFWE